MTVELNTLSPKKWVADYSGQAPTIDASNSVIIGDIAVDSNVASSTYIWRCQDDTVGDPLWIRETGPIMGEVYVTKSGNDTTGDGSPQKPFLTIKAAIDSITDQSSSNKYIIDIAPGNYTEMNPVYLKSFVSLRGNTSYTTILCNDNSKDLFVMDNVTRVENLGIAGPTTSGAAIVNNTASIALVRNISFLNCNNCVEVSNVSARMSVFNTSALGIGGGSIDKFISVEAGEVLCDNIEIVNGSEINTILYANGNSSIINGSILTAIGGNFVNGIVLDNESRINYDIVKLSDPPLVTSAMEYGLKVTNNSSARMTGLSIAFANVAAHLDSGADVTLLSPSSFQCNTAYEIGSNGASELNIIGGNIKDSTNYDLCVTSPNAKIHAMGVLLNDAKAAVNSSAELYSIELDDTEGDEGFNIRGELHVGSPEFPTESALGEGDSYSRGMLVYTYANATSTFTDVTTEAQSFSGSTFTFPGTDVDTAIYVASDRSSSDYFEHYGIKAKMSSAAVVTNNSDIIAEYYNGASWSNVSTMSTDSGGQFFPYADGLFQQADSVHIRYNNGLVSDSWGKTDPIVPATGTDRYWMRFRITTAIATAPVMHQFKLHTNRFEINSDGFTEYFGSGRPRASLGWVAGSIKPTLGVVIGDTDIWYSDNLKVGMIENQLNADDNVSFHSSMPASMDTSTPVLFRLAFRPDSLAGGAETIEYTMRWTYANPDSTVYSGSGGTTPHPNEQSLTGSIAATDGEIIWLEELLDFSGALPRRDGGFGDILVAGIEPTGFSGTMAIMVVDAKYTKWCEGEHL